MLRFPVWHRSRFLGITGLPHGSYGMRLTNDCLKLISNHEHLSLTSPERTQEQFLERCRAFGYHSVDNIKFINGRWHAIASKESARFRVDYDLKLKSLVQGVQLS